jgi:thiamine-phosphate pyrophosphorylase
VVTATPTGVVVLTDRRLCERPLVEVVAAAVEGGAGWVILRERDLAYPERRALADDLRVLVGDRLIVAGTDPLGGNAMHLPANASLSASGLSVSGPRVSGKAVPRNPVEAATSRMSALSGGRRSDPRPEADERSLLVGRSCHDADELAALSDEDYVTLSPIYPTATKPGYGPALGPEGAAALRPAVPWLALGGIDSPERAAACARAGAAGVAVLGAVMRAVDPAATVRVLVSGLGR